MANDLVHVQEHSAACTGSQVEYFLGRFVQLCESIERMATAGGPMWYEDHAAIARAILADLEPRIVWRDGRPHPAA